MHPSMEKRVLLALYPDHLYNAPSSPQNSKKDQYDAAKAYYHRTFHG